MHAMGTCMIVYIVFVFLQVTAQDSSFFNCVLFPTLQLSPAYLKSMCGFGAMFDDRFVYVNIVCFVVSCF